MLNKRTDHHVSPQETLSTRATLRHLKTSGLRSTVLEATTRATFRHLKTGGLRFPFASNLDVTLRCITNHPGLCLTRYPSLSSFSGVSAEQRTIHRDTWLVSNYPNHQGGCPVLGVFARPNNSLSQHHPVLFQFQELSYGS